MTPAERSHLLADSKIGVISFAVAPTAAGSDRNATLAVPIWYRYEPEIGVTVLMDSASRKGRAVADTGRFTLTVTDSTGYRYVMAEGPVIEQHEASVEELRRLSRDQLGETAGDRYVAGWEGRDSLGAIYVMRPERWYGADLRAEIEALGTSLS